MIRLGDKMEFALLDGIMFDLLDDYNEKEQELNDAIKEPYKSKKKQAKRIAKIKAQMQQIGIEAQDISSSRADIAEFAKMSVEEIRDLIAKETK